MREEELDDTLMTITRRSNERCDAFFRLYVNGSTCKREEEFDDFLVTLNRSNNERGLAIFCL
jgi:hypothetical protein